MLCGVYLVVVKPSKDNWCSRCTTCRACSQGKVQTYVSMRQVQSYGRGVEEFASERCRVGGKGGLCVNGGSCLESEMPDVVLLADVVRL